jgi:hypothetical protein
LVAAGAFENAIEMRHLCAPKDTLGGLCEGVAVYPQNSNNRLKFIELKQRLDDLPSAKAQLRKGVETVRAKLPAGFGGLDFSYDFGKFRPESLLPYEYGSA